MTAPRLVLLYVLCTETIAIRAGTRESLQRVGCNASTTTPNNGYRDKSSAVAERSAGTHAIRMLDPLMHVWTPFGCAVMVNEVSDESVRESVRFASADTFASVRRNESAILSRRSASLDNGTPVASSSPRRTQT